MSESFNIRLSCPQCYKYFNEEKRCPRVIPECGHSLCQACLIYNNKRGLTIQTNTILCPLCFSKASKPIFIGELFTYFPKNFFGLDFIRLCYKNVLCRHYSEKKKFLCFGKLCCQRIPFCIFCYEEVHFGCDRRMIIKLKDASNKVRFQPKLELDPLFHLINQLKQTYVTSNQEFFNELTGLFTNRLNGMQALLNDYFNKPQTNAHIWDSVYEETTGLILCTFNHSFIETTTDELNDLLTETPLLSTQQFLFQFFIIAFRTIYKIEKKPLSKFKHLNVNIKSLESIANKKSLFSETKFGPFYDHFKNEQVFLFSLMKFNKFATESVAYQKSLLCDLELQKTLLLQKNDELLQLEKIFQEPLSLLKNKIENSFEKIENNLIFKCDDFYNLYFKQDKSKQIRPLNKNLITRNLIQTQIFQSQFYFSEEDLNKLETTLLLLSPGLQDIVHGFLVDITHEFIYDFKMKRDELQNLGVFVRQNDDSLFLKSFFKKKLSVVNLSEIRSYLTEYSDEVQFIVIRALMVTFVISCTKSQLETVCQIRNNFSTKPELKTILENGIVFRLNQEKRAEWTKIVEILFVENPTYFEKYYQVCVQKKDIEAKIDALENRLCFELLALEFFGIFK